MKEIRYLIFIIILFNITYSTYAESNNENLKEEINKIYIEAHKDSTAWNRMAEMCDLFGPRLTGSENLNNALVWAEKKMKEDGLSNVVADEVELPSWVRGKEYFRLVSPWSGEIPMLGLGGSIGTNGKILKGKVIPISSKEDLDAKKDLVKNNIVLFDEKYLDYGHNVQYRVWGSSWAAKYGAIASIIRPVTPKSNQNAHTGVMRYVDTIQKIPCLSITDEGANLLRRLYTRGITPEVEIYMEAHESTPRMSYNVMGEYRGTTMAGEIVACGGHSDSWDAGIGTGAHDDASACIASWEAVKLLKRLGLKTKRTIRTVLWADEEYRQTGGKKYAEKHGKEPHLGLLEFDSGCFTPNSVGFTGPDSLYDKLKSFESYFSIIDTSFNVNKGGGGVDVRGMQDLGYPVMGLGTKNDSYFLYHHSPLDVPESVNPKELNDCVAAIAIIMYIYGNF
ncbi:MAG: M20/M25/M40 family metallo-hydrolase [bacterium]